MIRNYLYQLSVILLLVSCSKDIDFSPPYEGDKIVINGYISPNEGAKIKITHSINPVGKYLLSDSLLVKDAFAVLYENGVKLADLKYAGKGFYVLPDSPAVELVAGHSYQLMVESDLYGKAESEEIILPERPEIDDFKFEEIVKTYYQENALFTFSIAGPKEKESCFSIDVVTTDNKSLYVNTYQKKEGENYFESCEAIAGGYGGSMFVYSNECGFTNQVHKYATRTKYYDGQSEHYYNPLIVKISTVSRELFDYAKSYSQMSGLEFGFSEPPILKSNINGGYGLLYGSYTISYPIKLP